ncbi:CobW family GTP-binding protein [Staphylococcus massiliensis]|uniref:CobW family GTP-binding protein n=1 Tax=Staphylococcus massiliensis TaxID=555791 RepID=UPI001EDD799A|nr:GTP-binding protein [Staphylococcus massiliensis]MCG3400231.1 GTP-binding protein [Staphylococcus massiliensis]
MTANKPTITIINGFLGSGKTTLVNHYTTQILKENEKIAFIVNEFGNFDIDSTLFDTNYEKRALLNGCICCSLQDDLVQTILELVTHHDITHIVIEASGVSSPIDVIEGCQHPLIVDKVKAPLVIGVMDGPNYLNRHRYTDDTKRLMEQQMKASHSIIVNKVDQLSEPRLKALKDELETDYPNIEKQFTSYSKADLSNMHPKDVNLNSIAHKHPSLSSMTYAFQGAINRQLFYNFILKLPDSILRVKGFLKFQDDPEHTIIFQYANTLPDFEVIDYEGPLKIVIIGSDLDKARIRNQLDMLQFT